ncbi:MAG: UDP-N-acetylmuramate dehydrogenase [Fimbriimonadaceae bacterium]|nr:UDP-N-acetylmuramate dehydrogenase [Fimbriimonadaceae bacterium]
MSLAARLADLAARDGSSLSAEQPLAELTTWRIGGPAQWVLRPRSRATLVAAVALARAAGQRVWVMGNGSNLLCPDAGVRGLVLNLTGALAGVQISGDQVIAEAGAFLPKLARDTLAVGLRGLECVGGVPGTIGGGVVLNAGIPEATLGQVVERVDLLDEQGETFTLPAAELHFAHRSSLLQQRPWLVLAATLRLQPGDRAAGEAKLAEHLAYRRRTQPLKEATCGSVFRRPPGDFPGRVIEICGGKGLRVGGAEVSSLHANWIVNRGGATAADVQALIAELQRRARAQCGIELVPEVIVWEP